MKKIAVLAVLSALCLGVYAQTPKDVKYVFTEASSLNLIGKIQEGTPNPYHRVDTVKYKGFTKGENTQVRCPAGLAVVFKTNSTTISVKTEFGYEYNAPNTMALAYRGYDLYIKSEGKWLWAASGATKPGHSSDNLVLIKHMDDSEKECLLYLPIYCLLYTSPSPRDS